MSAELVPLERLPAVLVAHRAALAELDTPADAAAVERRLAAIVELAKRAELATPIVNEATFVRAEALERLAELVDAGQANGELETPGGDRALSEARTMAELGLDRRRVAEGRALARTGAVRAVRDDPKRNPDRLVSMNDLLKQAARRDREEAGRAARAEAEAAAAAALADEPELAELAVADVAEYRPAGVHAIITDPPYIGAGVLDLYGKLRDFAVETLADGGALVVMTSQRILDGVFAALAHDELAYRWTIAYRYATHENTVDHQRRVFDSWKPVLVFHRGAMPADAAVFPDVVESPAADKSLHAWGQSLEGFARLVRYFSLPGQLVADPFLGAGTTAVAALELGRRFAGCDVDEQAVETTRRRLTKGEE